MKAPGSWRRGIWRGGVLQVKVTNACDLDCKNCTAAVGLARRHNRIWFMKPDQYRTALRSLKGYHGVVGMFGGNPCIHPNFAELCSIFREEFPERNQRGLWSNRLFGKGAIARETFSPIHSNINVHRSSEAYDEFRRDWPEARLLEAGLTGPSMHGSWWIAMQDVIADEEERWRLIGNCFVNQTWSAEITVIDGELRVFFCEWAATRAEYADILNEPATGYPVVDGWWQRPINDFASQINHHCHRCGAPLNPRKIEDAGDAPEDCSETNRAVYMTIKGRPFNVVRSLGEIHGNGPATKYLTRGVMRPGS